MRLLPLHFVEIADLVCRRCGRTLVGPAHRRYCSNACRQADYRRRAASDRFHPGPAFITVPEIADDLGISRQTAYRWCSTGRIQGARSVGPGRGLLCIQRDLYDEWKQQGTSA
ncbi:helix-turn-helix transcriptional regulator [Nakamurella alba]|uniref:helix-turn-helix transcriptional regulator n=1 Tax=Nakamurella alba TaxID=2665158 RepID=UPI0038991A45